MSSYEEWRVTGEPGQGFGPYKFTWSPKRGDEHPEDKARNFVRVIERSDDPWTDGPHLQHRTVVVTSWRPAGPPPVNRPHPTCIDVTGSDQTRSEWACGPECPKEA